MDKRTLLAVVLSLAVILFYQFLLLPRLQPPQPPVTRVETEAPVAPPAQVAPAPPQAAQQAAPPAPSAELSRLLALQEKAVPRQIRISTGLYDLTVEGRGGSVAAWRLLDYRGRDGQPLEMTPLTPATPGQLGLLFKDDGFTRAFSEGAWLSDRDDLRIDRANPAGSLTLSRVDPGGLMVEKKLTFHDASYLVEVAVEVRNLGSSGLDAPWWLFWGSGLGRETEKGRGSYSGPLTFMGEKVLQNKLKKDGERLPVPPGFTWLGLTDPYFLGAFIPAGRENDAFFQRHDREKMEPVYDFGVGPSSTYLAPGGSLSFSGMCFVGPKSLNLLNNYDYGLEKSIDFGWFGWLGKPLLAILRFFFTFVRNYGVAIILLTLLVKICLFPVTLKMYRSMRAMQEAQPLVAGLKKKYKDDPQALNRETMALYKEKGINPAGGCLPMFIQIPIFIALYKVLSIAIELRGASFLYIGDLSAAEPYLGEVIHRHLPFFPPMALPLKLLVILMGTTMLIQQRLSPTMGDPKQAQFMMFMPLIFTAMFWNFTSGLVVYFLFSNILAIGEQLLIRRWSPSPSPSAEARKGRK